jgi:hypothetical protein
MVLRAQSRSDEFVIWIRGIRAVLYVGFLGTTCGTRRDPLPTPARAGSNAKTSVLCLTRGKRRSSLFIARE